MRERLVEPFRQRVGGGADGVVSADAFGDDAIGPGFECFLRRRAVVGQHSRRARRGVRRLAAPAVPDARGVAAIRAIGAARGDQAIERAAQIVEADAFARDERDDGAADFRADRVRVERQAAPLREVDHVERDDHGPVELQEFADQHQVARQVAGVDDDEDGVGGAIKAFALKHAAADVRFRRVEAEAIQSRQIDDFRRADCFRIVVRPMVAQPTRGRWWCRGNSRFWRGCRRGG